MKSEENTNNSYEEVSKFRETMGKLYNYDITVSKFSATIDEFLKKEAPTKTDIKNILEDTWTFVDIVLDDDSEMVFKARDLKKEEYVIEHLIRHDRFYKFLLGINGGKYLLMRLVDNWFLPNYDLNSAKKIINDIHSKREGSENHLFKGFIQNSGLLYSLSLFVIILLMLLDSNLFVNQCLHFTFSKCIFFGIYIIFLYHIIRLISHSYLNRLLVPRLFVAVFIGFLPLIIGEEAWKIAIRMNPINVGILFILTTTISFFYLRFEVSNRLSKFEVNKGESQKEILMRTLMIFFKGLTYSLLIGILIQDFIAVIMTENIQLHSNIPGTMGIIIPKVSLLFSGLALMIGIFVQIIWEDKPITHPL